MRESYEIRADSNRNINRELDASDAGNWWHARKRGKVEKTKGFALLVFDVVFWYGKTRRRTTRERKWHVWFFFSVYLTYHTNCCSRTRVHTNTTFRLLIAGLWNSHECSSVETVAKSGQVLQPSLFLDNDVPFIRKHKYIFNVPYIDIQSIHEQGPVRHNWKCFFVPMRHWLLLSLTRCFGSVDFITCQINYIIQVAWRWMST